MSKRALGIFGASGFAEELLLLARQSDHDVVAFIDREDSSLIGSRIAGVPVMTAGDYSERFPGVAAVLGVGSPQTRRKLSQRAADRSIALGGLVHPSVIRDETMPLPDDIVICAGNIITVNVKLGRGVQINMSCTIAHDVVIGDFVTLSPGVRVSGNVTIEDDVFIGTGAVIVNGTREEPLVIGNGAFVSAGACVLKSIPPQTQVVGMPARYIK